MKRFFRPAFLLLPPVACLIVAVWTAAQEPTPKPTPEPTPTPAPTPAPAPAPGPSNPAPKPEPGPTPSPKPEPKPEPAPAPTPKPESKASPVEPPPAKVEEKRPAPVTVVPTPPKKKTIVEVTKNCDEIKGLFTLFRDRENGSAYIFVRKDQLSREFIYFSHTVEGVLAAGHNRGQFHEETVFVMKRTYDKVEFVKQNTAFYFDPLHPLARASQANTSHAVMAIEAVVAENNEGVLLNAGNLFLKETLIAVKPNGGGDNKAFLGKLSDTKTKFTRLKSFPKNTLLAVEYVFDNPTPPRNEGDNRVGDVVDPRYVSVTIQHTLLAMPDNGYKPRVDDPRIGYFMTQLTDQTSTEVTPWRDFIHRWDLRKKDPDAPLSEPVEPIVWWIENTTPVEFRDTIRLAALQWNKSFEKVGFRNALIIREQPDDADWDADDIQYNVLRWTSSPKAPFGGYGPSFVNPRTGQILGSDIMLEFVFVKNRIMARRLWSEVGLAGMDAAEGSFDKNSCMAANVMQQGLLFGNQMMRLRKADDVEFDVLLKESLAQLILHELGHTLGLNHNFRASHLHTPQELQNRALTEKTGLSGSVMDYMPLNLGPDRARQGQYYINSPGPYDDWAIEYGYSVAAAEPEEEAKRLFAIAGRSHEPQLAFANDADDMRGTGKAIDPRAMLFDMSNDPVAYGTERCELVRQATTKLLSDYPTQGRSWQELTNAYISLTSEASNSLAAISRYVGGVLVERAFVGQVKDNPPVPFRPVDVETQKAAMQALAKYAFGPEAWTAPEALLSHLQQQRRGFDFRDSGEDPKLHERAQKIQRSLLDHLTHPNTQHRIIDSVLYGNKYPLGAMMKDLTTGIMEGEAQGAPITTVRQNLQLDYVDRLLNIVNGRSYQPAVQSVALAQLRRIQSSLKQQPATEANEAHVSFILYKIERGLDDKQS